MPVVPNSKLNMIPTPDLERRNPVEDPLNEILGGLNQNPRFPGLLSPQDGFEGVAGNI